MCALMLIFRNSTFLSALELLIMLSTIDVNISSVVQNNVIFGLIM